MADSDDTVGEDPRGATPDLGKTLQQARESRELSIEEISTELRIDVRLLRALEANRFDEIGAPVFAKGYLKQYGGRLGLDYADLLSDYYRIVGSTEVQIAPSRVIKLHDERQVTVWIIAAIVIALLAVLLVVWWLDQPDFANFGVSRQPASDALAPPVAQEPLADVSTVAFAGADGVSGRLDTGGLASFEAPAATVDSRAAPAQATADSPAAALAAAATLPASPAPAGSDPAEPPPGSVSVELSFAADCWTEVTDGTGERHYYGLAEAGARSTFYAVPPISFVIGNANGVEISINGRDYPIPGGGRQGALARFSVDAFDD